MQSAKACKSIVVEVLQFECCGLIHTLSKAGQWGTGPIGLRNRPGHVTGGTTRFQPNISSRDKRWCWLSKQTVRKIQVFQQYGLKDDIIKIYDNPFTNMRMSGWCVHNCVQEIQLLTYLNWSGRELENNHLEGWVVNNIHVLFWNLHINPSQI